MFNKIFKKKNKKETKMYPYCECFVKVDNTPGWLYTQVNGDKSLCEQKLTDLKNKHSIVDYRIYDGCKYYKEIENELVAHMPSASYIKHQISNPIEEEHCYWLTPILMALKGK